MFIYRLGFAPSLIAAKNWVTNGFIQVNNKVQQNAWKPIQLYDLVSFSPNIWSQISTNLVKIFYYGSKAA